MNTQEAVNYLIEKVAELETEIAALKAVSFQPSLKTAASEQKAVNEGAAAQYIVALPPDGYRQVTDRGQLIHIPFYYTD